MLVLEKAEEPEIKLPTCAGSWKRQESSRKTSVSASLTMPNPLTVDQRDGNTRPPYLPPEKFVCRSGQEATVRIGHGTTDWFQIRKRVHQGCILSPCLFNLYAEYIMRNTGWSTSWNQDCQEKLQDSQISRWHHPCGRKWRTIEPLAESERGEWKSWLKIPRRV